MGRDEAAGTMIYIIMYNGLNVALFISPDNSTSFRLSQKILYLTCINYVG